VPVKQRIYTFTTEKFIDGGALIQKWHRTTLHREPALTQVEKRSIQLVTCLEQGEVGARMIWIGSWMTLLPKHIGISDALDHAVQLMLLAHTAILHNRSRSVWIDSNAYAQAVKSLRLAITDATECLSSETLAAATILYYLEVSESSVWKGIMALEPS
jgi:hypothetical protein